MAEDMEAPITWRLYGVVVSGCQTGGMKKGIRLSLALIVGSLASHPSIEQLTTPTLGKSAEPFINYIHHIEFDSMLWTRNQASFKQLRLQRGHQRNR
jgi:hypothetical protein